jgi:hypothetical protein
LSIGSSFFDGGSSSGGPPHLITGNVGCIAPQRFASRFRSGWARVTSAAMVEDVPEEYVKSGHRFDTGPFLLDLYRLFGIVLGDQQLAKMETGSSTIQMLRGEYVYSELIRILTSTAVALRILFDQHTQEFTTVSQRPCGELFSDWPKTQKPEALTLREACNKIIHATKVHYDEVDPNPGSNPDQIGVYLLPNVYLFGKRDVSDWKAKLSVIEFAKFATAALLRFHH